MDIVGHLEVRYKDEWHYFRGMAFARTEILDVIRKKVHSKPENMSSLSKMFMEYDGDEISDPGWIGEADLWEIAKNRVFEKDWDAYTVFDMIFMKKDIGFSELRMIVWETP
jgi:hypothetical protein